MKFTREQALKLTLDYIDRAESYNDVRKQMIENGFEDILNADDKMAVMDAWNRSRVRRFDDYSLVAELEHWAKGGNYKNHLDGFYAVSPKFLVEEAKRRKWLVKETPSSTLISGNIGKPIILKKGAL